MNVYRPVLAAAILFAGLLPACAGDSSPPAGPTGTPQLEGNVELLESIPHEGKAWTEGLIVSDGILWESTGLEGKSRVRGLDRQTGTVLWSVANSEGFFGEGMVRAFGRTYVLSYTEGKAYLFGRADSHLVNSNGSAILYYRDPETFEIIKEVSIQYMGQPVQRLNELEFDGTYIWANQWQTSYVYRILERDPSDVVRYTLPAEVCPEGTPNGIAWDEDQGLFFVTGQACETIWKVRFQ